MNLNGISSLFLATAAEIGLGVALGIVAVSRNSYSAFFNAQEQGKKGRT